MNKKKEVSKVQPQPGIKICLPKLQIEISHVQIPADTRIVFQLQLEVLQVLIPAETKTFIETVFGY